MLRVNVSCHRITGDEQYWTGMKEAAELGFTVLGISVRGARREDNRC